MRQSSLIIGKFLEKLVPRISVSFGNQNSLNQSVFSRTKDRNPLLKISGVVYSISCSGCNGSHEGETSQLLGKWLSQHKGDQEKKNDHTALAYHTKLRNTDLILPIRSFWPMRVMIEKGELGRSSKLLRIKNVSVVKVILVN